MQILRHNLLDEWIYFPDLFEKQLRSLNKYEKYWSKKDKSPKNEIGENCLCSPCWRDKMLQCYIYSMISCHNKHCIWKYLTKLYDKWSYFLHTLHQCLFIHGWNVKIIEEVPKLILWEWLIFCSGQCLVWGTHSLMSCVILIIW